MGRNIVSQKGILVGPNSLLDVCN